MRRGPRQILHTRSDVEEDLGATMKSLRELKREYERQVVSLTLAQNGGSQRRSAAALGMSQRGLQKAIARHSLHETLAAISPRAS
jgi:transcriptional regulator with GAF, ATPase, and Fis domain